MLQVGAAEVELRFAAGRSSYIIGCSATGRAAEVDSGTTGRSSGSRIKV